MSFRKVWCLFFAAAVAAAFVAVDCFGQAAAGGAIVAIDEPAGYGGSAAVGRGAGGSGRTSVPRRSGTPARSTTAVTRKAPPRPQPVTAWKGPVLGDKYTFLNFEVVSAVKPYHTRDAKANGAKGLVQVEVLIDQNGNVLTARARTGNKLLHPEAERAALESRFNRPTADGRPARAMGFLVYRFGPAED